MQKGLVLKYICFTLSMMIIILIEELIDFYLVTDEKWQNNNN